VTPLVIIAAGKQLLSVRLCNNNLSYFFDLFVVLVVGVSHVSVAQIIRQKATLCMEPRVCHGQILFFKVLNLIPIKMNIN
jgi:hypothetical protein